MCADDTDSYVFNIGSGSTKGIVDKTQKLLNDWHEVLKLTGDDLKLSKCYWKTHDFQWRSRKFFLVMNTSLKLTIGLGSTKREVQHLISDHTRVLLGVLINPLHSLTQIEKTHEQKIAGHIVKLKSITLGPQDIIFGYQRC